MMSKILVKLPTVQFPQTKKAHPELVALGNRNEPLMQVKQSHGCGDRALQLEQNMKFLQEQHQAILISLQKEVETLRQRNRDLQFQLVFSNGSTNAASSPSSPEDSGGGFAKSKGSPVSVNVVSLQVELLERDLQDLRVSLREAKTHNNYLMGIIEQHKKSVDSNAPKMEKPTLTEVGIQADTPNDELLARLADAEAMVSCLRRENEDQRREMSAMKATANRGGGNGSARYHSNGHYNRGQGSSSGQEGQKFPPLPTQSYWHNGSRGNNSFDHNTEYRGRGRPDKQSQDSDKSSGTVLPQLRSNTSNKSESFNYPSSFHHKSRGYHNNGGSYYREGYRKYRGQRSQRDSKDREPREHNRDFKGKESKEQQQKDYKDSSCVVKDPKNLKEP